jgi:sporulation protein YlmC with PRC-barrel domain
MGFPFSFRRKEEWPKQRKDQIMKRNIVTTASLMVALGCGLSIGAQQLGGRVQFEGPEQRQASTLRSATVQNHNKASKLVGMKVKNPQHQELGQIEDIVIDLDSGRVAYAVLAVGSALGLGEQYIAIPVNAFVPAPSENHIILNADKARIEGAPRFNKNRWPEVNAPLRGAAQYWTTPHDGFSDYYYGRDDYRTDQDRYDRDGADWYRYNRSRSYDDRGDYYDRGRSGEFGRYPSDRYDRDRGMEEIRRRELYNRYDNTRYHNQGSAFRQSFKGKIIAVNPETRTMIVENDWGRRREFVFDDKPVLALKDTRNPKVIDLKAGFPVSVGYHEQPDGSYVAQTVIRTDTPEVK